MAILSSKQRIYTLRPMIDFQGEAHRAHQSFEVPLRDLDCDYTIVTSHIEEPQRSPYASRRIDYAGRSDEIPSWLLGQAICTTTSSDAATLISAGDIQRVTLAEQVARASIDVLSLPQAIAAEAQGCLTNQELLGEHLIRSGALTLNVSGTLDHALRHAIDLRLGPTEPLSWLYLCLTFSQWAVLSDHCPHDNATSLCQRVALPNRKTGSSRF